MAKSVSKKKIRETALALSLRFAESGDIPPKFTKKEHTKVSQIDIYTKPGRRFFKHVLAWIDTIQSILRNYDDADQAWRFITISPEVGDITHFSECKDYQDFSEYFNKRRGPDTESSTPDEIGGLAMLHTKLQREVQRIVELEDNVAV